MWSSLKFNPSRMDPLPNEYTRNNGSPTLRFEDDRSRMTRFTP